MMGDERFTLIMPSFNHERYIEQAILSVKNQTRPFDAVIFFSDGSRDRTLEIAQSLLGKDNRVIWLPELHKNLGLVTRLRQCADRLSNGYVMVLSGDDVLMPNACETFRDLARATRFEWAIGAVEITDQDLQRTHLVDPTKSGFSSDGHDVFRRLLRLDPWLPTQGWCYTVDLLRRVGGFDPRLRVEDYSLALRFARATQPVFTGTVISAWRREILSLSLIYSEQMWADHAKAALQFLTASPITVLTSVSGHYRAAGAAAFTKRHWKSALKYSAASLAFWPTPKSLWSYSRRMLGAVQDTLRGAKEAR